VDQGDHDPPWWTRSVQDHRGPRSDIFLMHDDAIASHWLIDIGCLVT